MGDRYRGDCCLAHRLRHDLDPDRQEIQQLHDEVRLESELITNRNRRLVYPRASGVEPHSRTRGSRHRVGVVSRLAGLATGRSPHRVCAGTSQPKRWAYRSRPELGGWVLVCADGSRLAVGDHQFGVGSFSSARVAVAPGPEDAQSERAHSAAIHCWRRVDGHCWRGSLWVAAGPALVRVSLPGGGLSAIVSLGDAISSSVAADSTGKVLVLGEANNAGTGIIERRNPTTGTLLAASTPLHGVFTPLVGGAIDGTAWVSESTGMMGYVQHYSLEPLAPIKPTCKAGMIAKTCVTGSNGLRARVVSRLVWLTQQAGGPSRNACVDPANGDILSPIALPMVNDQVLAIAARYLFIVSQPLPGSGSGQTVTEEPIPAACHAG